MVAVILAILILLWLLGYVQLPFITIPAISVFVINGRVITLYDLLIFILVLWVLSILPSPLREIAGLLLILWVLSTLGIIAIAGFSQIILIAIIIGVALSLLR